MPLFKPRLNRAHAMGSTSAPTTTSGTFATLPEMTVTLETSGYPLLIAFSGNFDTQRDDELRLRVYVDSVQHGGEWRIGANPDNRTGMIIHSIVEIESVAAGSHTVAIQWRCIAGTARAVGTNRSLTVTELDLL